MRPVTPSDSSKPYSWSKSMALSDLPPISSKNLPRLLTSTKDNWPLERETRFELATFCLEGRRSTSLSYSRRCAPDDAPLEAVMSSTEPVYEAASRRTTAYSDEYIPPPPGRRGRENEPRLIIGCETDPPPKRVGAPCRARLRAGTLGGGTRSRRTRTGSVSYDGARAARLTAAKLALQLGLGQVDHGRAAVGAGLGRPAALQLGDQGAHLFGR
jgi:hypothetical protein